MKRDKLYAGLVALLACCSYKSLVAPEGDKPLEGEVWLTADQVEKSHLRIEAVEERPIVKCLVAFGRIALDEQRVLKIYPPLAGRVTRIHVKLGQHVKKGDPLISIYAPDMGEVSSDLIKAKSEQLLAQKEYQRQKDLFAHHATSAQELESAEGNYQKAVVEVERAKQKMLLFQRFQLDTVTHTYLVRAPMEGDVLAKAVTLGMEVQSLYGGGDLSELLVIGSTDRVWLIADLYEQDISVVRMGDVLNAIPMALPDRQIQGRIEWISQEVDPVTHVLHVRTSFANPDRALKPEMTVRVRIQAQEKRALAIPYRALFRYQDQAIAFMQVGQTSDGRFRFRKVPVETGDFDDQWIAIRDGLAKGALVVTAGGVLLLPNL
ncbi:efflux RND transporter periplasmic adaptor subunit [Pajaroellobacter abortibovis]|uniref:Uncharacterized protein n=1 Tax=Pajaroellobacter abortibovis TaxID=1882918 RepID=A0A1L6MV85_9BACT|nr:efflux RND transporter periplasmic adaptor subunit [Pajaroellobacter abortibovis]APR99365.1 hypothetical protein BCY86_00730 [Pajaroellobacter abortibovis]